MKKQASRVVKKPDNAGNLNDRVARKVGIDIVGGRYATGTQLPTEEELSKELGVSRTAYREALRILATKGLVTSRPKTGTKVNPRREWLLLDPDVLGWMFASPLSIRFVQDLFELRQIVEPAAAALAAIRRTNQQLSSMGHALEEMASLGLRNPRGQQADEAFHDMILQASGNEALSALTKSISFAVRWTTLLKFKAAKLPNDSLPAHRRLFAAIAESDADGAREMATTLIQESLEDMKATLSQDPSMRKGK